MRIYKHFWAFFGVAAMAGFVMTDAHAGVCDELEREALQNTVAIQCATAPQEAEDGTPMAPDFAAAAHAQRQRTYMTELFGRSGCNNKQLADAVLAQMNRRPNCPK